MIPAPTRSMDVEEAARLARQAADVVACLSTDAKNNLLRTLADRLHASRAAIREANENDLSGSRQAGLPQAKLRRLEVADKGIDQMIEGVRQVASLPDPVGQITKDYIVPSGLHVRKVRAPLGVIAMIYEARPNVTVDAFALCFKAGNCCLLKGGKEASHTNEALAEVIHASLSEQRLPTAAVAALTATSREDIRRLLALDRYIDLVIPRGGTELIQFVHEHSRIPMVQHFHGVCHIFVDDSADSEMALRVCTTAKTSAPATCNAVEAILVHRRIAETFVPRLVAAYQGDGVEVRGDPAVCSLATGVGPAEEDDWGREFLDLIVAVRVVDDVDEAIAHIRRYGSNHTDSILSRDHANQQRFLQQVQSSCVLVNASTRFNDGFQLGLGAEIGISTSRIHAYGPMGLEELTTQRYLVEGDGQVR